MRYSFGRKTYAYSIVIDNLIDHWDNFSDWEKKQVIKEVEESIKWNSYKLDILRAWEEFLEKVKEEL